MSPARKRNNSALASPSPKHCRFPTENGIKCSGFLNKYNNIKKCKRMPGFKIYNVAFRITKCISDFHYFIDSSHKRKTNSSFL